VSLARDVGLFFLSARELRKLKVFAMNRLASTDNEADGAGRAELSVMQSRAKLSHSLKQAGKSGENLARRCVTS